MLFLKCEGITKYLGKCSDFVTKMLCQKFVGRMFFKYLWMFLLCLNNVHSDIVPWCVTPFFGSHSQLHNLCLHCINSFKWREKQDISRHLTLIDSSRVHTNYHLTGYPLKFSYLASGRQPWKIRGPNASGSIF